MPRSRTDLVIIAALVGGGILALTMLFDPLVSGIRRCRAALPSEPITSAGIPC
jgi:hypothetical protein